MTRFLQLGIAALLLALTPLFADELPSWNDGPAKQAILEFVRKTTEPGPDFLEPEKRIATFDQDGTLWVEQPVYPQVQYCIDRLPDVLREKPALSDQEPFRTLLTGDTALIAAIPLPQLETLFFETVGGMTVEEFSASVRQWLATAKHPRWKRPYTDLTYQPMQELLYLLRSKGYRTYMVTGGEQDFVRVYSQETYGFRPEEIIGSVMGSKFDDQGKPVLIKEPSLVLNTNFGGKPVGIHLFIGQRPAAAFGNSLGDQQMLEYATGRTGLSLGMLVLHDDAEREYAYGPARGLPPSNIGTFPPALDEFAKKSGWFVISMKNDWRRVFSFEPLP